MLVLSVVKAHIHKKRCVSQSPAKGGGALSGTLYFAQHIIKHGRQPNSRHLRASSKISASISLTSAPFLWARNRLHADAKVAVPHLQSLATKLLSRTAPALVLYDYVSTVTHALILSNTIPRKLGNSIFLEQQATQVQVQSSPRLTPNSLDFLRFRFSMIPCAQHSASSALCGYWLPRVWCRTGAIRCKRRTSMAALPTHAPTAYGKLCEKLKELSNLNSISGLIGWDELTFMPKNAADARAAQKATLAGVVYDKVAL